MGKKDLAFIVTTLVLVILLTFSSYAYFSLRLRYRSLQEDYESLGEEYAQLESRYQTLLKNYTELTTSYRKLDEELTSLSLEYQRLKGDHQELQEEYDSLKAKYEEIVAENRELQSRYLRLNESYSELVKDYQVLQEKYAELEASYGDLGGRIADLRSKLEAISLRVLISGEVFKLVLNQSRIDEIDEIVHEELGLSPDSPPRVKALKIFEWITLNTQYVRDQYHPYYQSGILDYAEEYLEPVNETLSLGEGDCEDLAVLAYAMLRAVLREGEEIYLIVLNSIEIRHVAVLYKSDDKFLIIDPAGSYISDALAALQMVIRRMPTGELMLVTLIPISINPRVKSWLIEQGFAEIKYLRSEDRSPTVPGKFSNIEDTIAGWIDHWRDEMPGAYVYMVANETYTRTFQSTSDFINWIKG